MHVQQHRCTEKMKRKDMKDHEEDDKVHLHLSLEKINELNIGLKELEGKKLQDDYYRILQYFEVFYVGVSLLPSSFHSY